MRTLKLSLSLGYLCLLAACQDTARLPMTITAPDERIRIEFLLSDQQAPHYRVSCRDELVIDTSLMAFEFKGQPPLREGLRVVDSHTTTVDEIWEMPWGEQRQVRNHYRELVVELAVSLRPRE